MSGGRGLGDGVHVHSTLMLLHVLGESFAAPTGEGTDVACEGFLPGVSHLMLLEVVLGPTGVATGLAGPGLQVLVDERVHLEVGGLTEGGAAHTWHMKGFRPRCLSRCAS